MTVFNRYILKNLLLATVFITATLSAVIILTQSLRFLELIIDSGAGAHTFWTLTFLALPRFWEVIIPLAATIATLFTYTRLKDHSELVIMRSTGFSPFKIARPAFFMSAFFLCILWGLTLWGTPYALSSLQKIRNTIKSQFSVSLLHEGVFNNLGKDFTVYVQKRLNNGHLEGLMIYDKSHRAPVPTTILAQKGILSEQDGTFQIVVYDGSRQTFNKDTKILQRLNFKQYTVDLPLLKEQTNRWKEPDERTLNELLNPDTRNKRDLENAATFKVEIHRRFTAPLLIITFIAMAAVSLILGPVQRNPSSWKNGMVILGVVTIQGLFISITNMAKNNDLAIIGMYLVPLIPLLICLYFLSAWSEADRRKIFYSRNEERS